MPLTDNEFEVRVNSPSLTIEIYQNGQWVYEIDLLQCTSSAQMLDWIMQVHSKGWCTAGLISEVITALNNASMEFFGSFVQGVFCPNGIDREAIWRQPRAVFGEKPSVAIVRGKVKAGSAFGS